MTRRVTALRAGNPETADWVVRASDLTRRAFAAAEEVPGLPVPDGAGDEAGALRDELRAGATLWIAVDEDQLTGALRVTEGPDRSWEVHRVAVSPDLRHGGVAASLLAAVESGAAARGIRRVWLNAVVERGLPPLYARLGYRVAGLEPAAGKLLSELVMHRLPASPRRARLLADGWVWSVPRPTVTWFLADGALLAVAGQDRSVRAAGHAAAGKVRHLGDVRLAGVDANVSSRPYAPDGPDGPAFMDLARRLGPGAEPLAPGVVRFAAGRTGVPGHVMPRRVDPDLYAVWRYSPGREVSLAPTRTPAGSAVPQEAS